MKTLCALLGLLTAIPLAMSQNVGVGTNFPQEKLDINGAIKLGSTTGMHTGTIRWNPDRSDFEGFNGETWLSLTDSHGGWGQTDHFAYEQSGTDFLLYHQDPDFGSNLGFSLEATDQFIYAGAYDDYAPGDIKGAGMIYVIARTPDHWKNYPEFEFASPNPMAGEYFGYSMDRSSDYLLAGAPGWSQSKGRAIIYSFDNNGHQIYHGSLYQADSNPSDRFGHAVAITDDFAFVGAPWREVAGVQNAGRLTIFKREPVTNKFLLQTNISAPDAGDGDAFGKTLAASGNYVAVAAPLKTMNGLVDQGKVYIYKWNGVNWTLFQQLVSPEPAAYDRFGESLFMKGDTLFIASTQANSSEEGHHGRVYYYLRIGQQWIWQSTIEPSDGEIYDSFGKGLCMKNGDLVIGAPGSSIGLMEACGKAYIFHFNGTGWIEQSILAASNKSISDAFGLSVVMAGHTAIVSAPLAPVNFINDNGRLYYFEKE